MYIWVLELSAVYIRKFDSPIRDSHELFRQPPPPTSSMYLAGSADPQLISGILAITRRIGSNLMI